MSDIVDRLRKRVVTRWVHAVGSTPRSSGYSPDRECHEAADEIARLRAENAALREFYNASRALMHTLGHPEATAEDENRAEARFEAANRAVSALDAAIDAAKGGAA